MQMTSVWPLGVVAGLLCLTIRPVQAYTDFRGKQCLRKSVLDAIDKGYVKWDGRISLIFKCDAGYDFPLNVPPRAEIVCQFNKTWMPNYLPDCNKEVRPSEARHIVTMKLDTTKATVVKKSGQSYAFKNMAPLSKARLCKGMRGGSCRLKTNLTKTNGGEFTLVVNINLPFDKSLMYGFYVDRQLSTMITNIRNGLKVLKAVDLDSRREVKFHCPSNTLPVRNPSIDAVLCRGCSVGFFLDKTNRVCQPCPPGHYQENPLSRKCQLCPNMKLAKNDETLLREINAQTQGRLEALSRCPGIANENGMLRLVNKTKILYHTYRRGGCDERYSSSVVKLVVAMLAIVVPLVVEVCTQS